MTAACLELSTAVIGGTMLTFLFDSEAPRAARIAMGTCLGLALLGGVGFVFALWIGLNAASIAVSGGTMLLPLLLLISPKYRVQVSAQLWPARSAWQKTGNRIGYLLFY